MITPSFCVSDMDSYWHPVDRDRWMLTLSRSAAARGRSSPRLVGTAATGDRRRQLTLDFLLIPTGIPSLSLLLHERSVRRRNDGRAHCRGHLHPLRGAGECRRSRGGEPRMGDDRARSPSRSLTGTAASPGRPLDCRYGDLPWTRSTDRQGVGPADCPNVVRWQQRPAVARGCADRRRAAEMTEERNVLFGHAQYERR